MWAPVFAEACATQSILGRAYSTRRFHPGVGTRFPTRGAVFSPTVSLFPGPGIAKADAPQPRCHSEKRPCSGVLDYLNVPKSTLRNKCPSHSAACVLLMLSMPRYVLLPAFSRPLARKEREESSIG